MSKRISVRKLSLDGSPPHELFHALRNAIILHLVRSLGRDSDFVVRSIVLQC